MALRWAISKLLNFQIFFVGSEGFTQITVGSEIRLASQCLLACFNEFKLALSCGALQRVEAEFNNRLPIYLSTRRGGTVLLEHCAKVGESGSERQSLMNMLVTLTKRWNAVRTLITQRYVVAYICFNQLPLKLCVTFIIFEHSSGLDRNLLNDIVAYDSLLM
jgi:hypothetical protein